MAEHLKRPIGPPPEASEELRRTVSEMLADIERRGEAAVREHSRRLDGWDPPSFTVGKAERRAAEAAVDDELLAVNVKGTFFAAQAAVRRMLAGDGGSIVTLSSQMGHVGAPRRSAYCTTKHAIEGLTRALAVELAPHDIRVNAVAPTFVETPMTRPFLADPAFRADVLDRIPLGRLGSVDDVANAVVFLASPAASLVTGASLLVDGGWTAQ